MFQSTNSSTNDRFSRLQSTKEILSRAHPQWTPKHIGLASTLHQATWSKQLVQLFQEAGHTISYRDILRMDTALANETLKTMDDTNGSVLPPNLIPGKFVHFTADNIDINDSRLMENVHSMPLNMQLGREALPLLYFLKILSHQLISSLKIQKLQR